MNPLNSIPHALVAQPPVAWLGALDFSVSLDLLIAAGLGAAAAGAVGACALKLRRERDLLRTGIGMTTDAAGRLLNDGEGSLLNLGLKDPKLVKLAERFDELCRKAMEQGRENEETRRELEAIDDSLRVFFAAGRHLAALSERNSVLQHLADATAAAEGAIFSRAWLLHRYLGGSVDEAYARLQKICKGVERRTAAEVREVGLMPAASRQVDEAGVPNLEKALPLERVLRVARTERALINERATLAQKGEAGAAPSEAPHFYYHALPMVTGGQCIGVVELVTGRPLREVEHELLRETVERTATLIKSLQSTDDLTKSKEETELKNLDLSIANRKLQRSNEKLAEADRLKNEFLSNTSHELRTPLNSVLGFAQLILSGACNGEEDIKTNVRLIRDSAQRLLNLINEVLDLAKIEAGKLNLTLAPLDVRTVLNAAHSLLQVQAAEKKIELKLEMPDGELPQVRADQMKLYQAVVNLVGNAIKFTQEGSVTVRLKPGELHGFVTVEIVDTGIGIPADVQKKLFQNFVQGDGSISRKFGGTGLGLAISRKLIHLQGGAISLHSRGEKQGTTATIHLPLWSDDSDVRPQDAEPPTAIEAMTETVEKAQQDPAQSQTGEGAAAKSPEFEEDPARPLAVIIEDYGEMRRYLAELLQGRGWRVRCAATAAAGLDLIQEFRPAAILLDIYLPAEPNEPSVRSGYDVIRMLNQDVGMASVPIFVISGMAREASDALLSQTVLMPVEIYSKPLNAELFLESLDRLSVAAK